MWRVYGVSVNILQKWLEPVEESTPEQLSRNHKTLRPISCTTCRLPEGTECNLQRGKVRPRSGEEMCADGSWDVFARCLFVWFYLSTQEAVTKNFRIGNKLNWFHFLNSKLGLAKRELLREKILHIIFLQREQKLLRRVFFFEYQLWWMLVT